ncbi:MAG: sulfatase [Chloroflexi bacterium]|nr:sulfatase [Chloroflexota bacterium]
MTAHVSARARIVWIVSLVSLLLPLAQPLWSVPSAAAPARPAPDTRPNIVLVLADDLDVRLNTLNYTPYIRDRLMNQGVTFDNALVPVSLCCPSRVSLLRGQYVHNHQVFTNGPPDGGFQKAQALNLENSTIATVLQASGYRTVLMGKYLNGYPITSSLTYIPPGWDEFYSPSSDAAYFGFNYSMNMNGVLAPFGSAPEDYMTDVLSRTAVNFITRTVSGGSPFFMVVGTYAPHGPSTPAPRHTGLFTDVVMPVGGSFNELDNSDKPPLIASLPLLTVTQILEMNDHYRNRLRSMQAIDEMVASLVDTLQAAGVLTNTYFVFTSDNGYHMGQHRFPPGKYTNYEEDLRVPLIVRGPGVPVSQTVSALVSTMDLPPTFAEIAQTAMPAYVDGRSLLGLLAGSPASWRQVFFLEQYPFSSQLEAPSLRNGLLEPDEPDQTYRRMQEPASLCASTTVDPKPLYTGIRGTRYKYVEHHACDREIYDLLNDPYEMDNIYSLTTEQTRSQLAAWLQVMESCAAAVCRAFEMAPPQIVFLPNIAR